MAENQEVLPEMVLRLGTHAEKDFFLKGIGKFDGVIVGANLLEGTPGATSSLLLKFSGKKKKIYIDPVTYSFGIGAKFLMTERVNKKTGETWREVKNTYKKLSKRYGGVFEKAISRNRTVVPSDFNGAAVRDACRAIGRFQEERIKDEFAADDELKNIVDKAPTPAAVFAPYFYLPKDQFEPVLKVNTDLIVEMVKHFAPERVHAVLCIHKDHLQNDEVLNYYFDAARKSRVSGVWFWVSKLHETRADANDLSGLKKWTEKFSAIGEVNNLHGGFFSICLSKFGMKNVSHGIGYGEAKDVIPVISGGAPSVRYLLPALHRRYGVPDVERTFEGLGISAPEDFFEKICDCLVCKGVIKGRLTNFRQFGELYLPSPESKKEIQTPASTKRARFHFLFARRAEFDLVAKKTLAQIQEHLESGHAMFAEEESLADGEKGHPLRWKEVLGN